ncbi:hypothetical protein M569_01942, partial [Genlisea aurea]
DAVPPCLPWLKTSTIASAVDALLKYKAKSSSKESFQLLHEEEYIYLNVSLKKIPTETRSNPWRIPLSNPIWGAESQVCLIIDDRPQTPTPPSDHLKKLIKSQNIPVSKVLKISKLKSDFKPYESRRKLCGSYDLFLVDRRVIHLLPKLIGKEFFKKKKLPLAVDLSKKCLKSQVNKALGNALFYLRTGTCSVMKIGKVDMEKEDIVQNVMDAIAGAVQLIPKKWEGIRSLHLKCSDSVALPIYQTLPEMKLKIQG